MRLSIKAKQVAGVTSIVGLAVVLLSALYLSSLARVRLEESQARADLLASAIFHRAREVVANTADPVAALNADDGLRSILEASVYSRDVTFAAIADVTGKAVAHSDASQVNRVLPDEPDLAALTASSPLTQIRAIYASGGRTFQLHEPLLLSNVEFGSIRIGVSTLLIRNGLNQALRPALLVVLAALLGASLVATVMAQLLLRPIHVIRSGLTRLGQGEFGVRVDLPGGDEFGELGEFFNTVSARLSADRAPTPRTLESVMNPLEDAVAVVDADGCLVFGNRAMMRMLPSNSIMRRFDTLLPSAHPYRTAVQRVLTTHQPSGPENVNVSEDGGGERLISVHPIAAPDAKPLGVVLVARDVSVLNQIQSTISYSRKLAALSRVSAGVAHEIKNPLNATVIHLELLREHLSKPADGEISSAAMEHVAVIAAQMRRLDDVVQGFLKFIRPEDLKTQPISPAALVEAVRPVIAAEADSHRVDFRIEVPADLPDIRVDPGMMEQALVNLGINACQAMRNGGRLRIAAAIASGRRVGIVCEDTGHGIKPDDLGRIFNLYFTTKEQGSGIGLSMVYRAVQLNDGEIEVESTPGRGTTFRLLLPQA
jgi:signal transduction histidine kinase